MVDAEDSGELGEVEEAEDQVALAAPGVGGGVGLGDGGLEGEGVGVEESLRSGVADVA